MRANYVCKVSGGTVQVTADTMLSVDQIKELASEEHEVVILDIIEERPIGKAFPGEEEYDIPLRATFRRATATTKPKSVRMRPVSLDQQIADCAAVGDFM